MIFFNGVKIEFGNFPNGETIIDKPFFLKNKQSTNSVLLKYESDADLFRLFLVRKSMWFPCSLEISYFPYSRMDRASDEYVFTLKAVAKYINMMEWDHVVIYEPHSDVTPALINKCKSVSLIPHLLEDANLPEYYAVFYPDAGAQKRYSDLAKGQTELIGFKKRDFKTGKILSLQIIGEKGPENTVVIIDDLCSKGGTFILAAQKLRELGFTKVILVVGHCEETILTGQLLITDWVDKIYTTDSIIQNYQNISKLHIERVFETTNA